MEAILYHRLHSASWLSKDADASRCSRKSHLCQHSSLRVLDLDHHLSDVFALKDIDQHFRGFLNTALHNRFSPLHLPVTHPLAQLAVRNILLTKVSIYIDALHSSIPESELEVVLLVLEITRSNDGVPEIP